MALLLSEVPEAVVPCVCRRVHQPFILGQSLLHVATSPWQKSSGSRESLGVQVDPDHLYVLADTHTIQRSAVHREPEEEGFTALGFCGEPSLVTIKYLLTRRPQMSGSAVCPGKRS